MTTQVTLPVWSAKHYWEPPWYAGAETGYRYHLTEDTFIEPQAELGLRAQCPGKHSNWKDGEMDPGMKNRISAVDWQNRGVELGKTFRGKDWSVTARCRNQLAV